MTRDDLPPLPNPELHDGILVNAKGKYIGTFSGYTADQMREYAKAAVEAEREACAKVCEEFVMGSPFAAAIRARGETK